MPSEIEVMEVVVCEVINEFEAIVDNADRTEDPDFVGGGLGVLPADWLLAVVVIKVAPLLESLAGVADDVGEGDPD